MTDLKKTIDEIARPKIEELAGSLHSQFLGGLENILDGASSEQRVKVSAAIKAAAEMKAKAIMAKTAQEADDYLAAVKTSERRVRTILLAEKIVTEEAVASAIMNGLSQSLKTFGLVAKSIVSTMVKAAIEGGIKGAVDGFDPSDLLPYA